jgi:hypothetical protein
VQLLAAALVLVAGCASARAVRPVGRHRTEISMGIGGPLSESYRTANPPPIPVTTVGGRYGLTDRADVFGTLHASSWVFGITWIDAGGAFALLPCKRQGFCLLASGTTHVLTNFRDLMLLEQLELVASHRFGAWTPYLGWDALFELAPALDHMPIGFTGLRVDHHMWFVQGELRWYAPFSDGTRSTSHYLSPGGAGALGLSFAVGARL